MNYTVYITINENLNLHKQAQNIFECISVIKKTKIYARQYYYMFRIF